MEQQYGPFSLLYENRNTNQSYVQIRDKSLTYKVVCAVGYRHLMKCASLFPKDARCLGMKNRFPTFHHPLVELFLKAQILLFVVQYKLGNWRWPPPFLCFRTEAFHDCRILKISIFVWQVINDLLSMSREHVCCFDYVSLSWDSLMKQRYPSIRYISTVIVNSGILGENPSSLNCVFPVTLKNPLHRNSPNSAELYSSTT